MSAGDVQLPHLPVLHDQVVVNSLVRAETFGQRHGWVLHNIPAVKPTASRCGLHGFLAKDDADQADQRNCVDLPGLLGPTQSQVTAGSMPPVPALPRGAWPAIASAMVARLCDPSPRHATI